MTRRRLITAHLFILLAGVALTVLAAIVPLVVMLSTLVAVPAWGRGPRPVRIVPDVVPTDDDRLWRATRLPWIPERPSKVHGEQSGLFLSRIDFMTTWRPRGDAGRELVRARADAHVHDRLVVMRAGFPAHAFEGGYWIHSSTTRETWDLPPTTHVRAAHAFAWERHPGQTTYVPSGIRWDGFAICVVFWSTVVWLPTLGLRALNRTLRRRRGECPECGYDLARAGLASCPECGGVAPDATDADDGVVEAAGSASRVDGAPSAAD